MCVVSKPPRPGHAAAPASSGAQDRPTNYQPTRLQTLTTALPRRHCDPEHRYPAPKFASVSLTLRPATELHPSTVQRRLCLRHRVTPDRPSLALRSYCCTKSPRPSYQPLAPTFLFRTCPPRLWRRFARALETAAGPCDSMGSSCRAPDPRPGSCNPKEAANSRLGYPTLPGCSAASQP